jgi:membrane-bound lytic murein transglycosylase
MSMTKRDYVAIARILSEELDLCETVGELRRVESTIQEIAAYMEKDNSRFDALRFTEAAGL